MGTKTMIRKTTLGPAPCAVELGDGSERGEYVNQDYILQKLGRPHRCIQLMYCYFPNDEGWPKRASAVFERTDTGDAWGDFSDEAAMLQYIIDGMQENTSIQFWFGGYDDHPETAEKLYQELDERGYTPANHGY